jgi:hypothetical protein
MSSNEIADLVGDGNAKVSVSFGMADKDYGTGFDAHVTVSLTCDQQADIIGFAYEAASEVASDMIREAALQAKELWEEREDGG